MWGLCWFYEVRGPVQTAQELAEQLLTLAECQQDPALLLQANRAMGQTLFWQGELARAHQCLEQGIALYDPLRHHSLAFRYGQDPGVGLRTFAAHILWYLGYPDQALERMQGALTLARELSHPFSLAFALSFIAWLHHYRRESRATQVWAEAAKTLCREQGFALFLAQQTVLQGWALAEQGQVEEGIAQMRQGLTARQATGARLVQPYWLLLLAEVYGKTGQAEKGLRMLAEARAVADQTGEHFWEAEMYRLQGELILMQAERAGSRTISREVSLVVVIEPPVLTEAEACFQQALDVARRQQAKSLELRAAMSLARLWQQLGKQTEAQDLLAPIYGWFTEGFDTADLQDAKALLDELSESRA